MHTNTKRVVGVGLFTAIVVALQLLGGVIHFGMFSISLVLIPIVVGAAVYGWQAGAWLGLAFGITVLLSGDAGAFLAVNPLGTVVVVLLKGVICGLVAGLVYHVLAKRNRLLAVLGAAIICPVANTGIFLIGCWVFFLDTINEWASAFGYQNAVTYVIYGLVGVNFLLELGVNVIAAPLITRIIRIGTKE